MPVTTAKCHQFGSKRTGASCRKACCAEPFDKPVPIRWVLVGKNSCLSFDRVIWVYISYFVPLPHRFGISPEMPIACGSGTVVRSPRVWMATAECRLVCQFGCLSRSIWTTTTGGMPVTTAKCHQFGSKRTGASCRKACCAEPFDKPVPIRWVLVGKNSCLSFDRVIWVYISYFVPLPHRFGISPEMPIACG